MDEGVFGLLANRAATLDPDVSIALKGTVFSLDESCFAFHIPSLFRITITQEGNHF